MKLLQRRIQDAAKRTGVNQLVVERDYAQSYVLLGIARHPVLYDTLVFKGGTVLGAVTRALAACRHPAWPRLTRRLLRLDLSWESPARRYLKVYENASA